MRILFCSLGSPGHTYPLLPLAVAARDSGHEIAFTTSGQFRDALAALGFRHEESGVPVTEAYQEGLRTGFGRESPDGLGPDELRELSSLVFGRLIPKRSAGQLAEVIERVRPELVVHDVSSYGAALAAAVAGIPAVCHGIGRESPDEFTLAIEDKVRGLAGELGVAVPSGRLMGMGNPYLDLYPDSMQDQELLDSGRRFPLRPVPFSDDSDLPEWVRTRDRGRPLAYLTLGTSGSGSVGALRRAVDGLAALDVDVLVSSGRSLDVSEFGKLPPRVRLESWVPQAKLFPELDLAAHHGGSGTTLGSLAAGVPQLCLPWDNDPFGSGDAVLSTGAGLRLLPDELTADAVREKAGELLADAGYLAAAEKMAAEIAQMPSPEEVAAGLARFAAG
ncbi:glycosyltransferase [Amycolatopsis sp. FU40]|uniref:Glycosyl transferases, related to UDP-glucuronosyltransferase n=1 Tax=Amycolatopsis sp. FU40 TaxID=2914159 RepID=G4XIK5_9PSEU|nr:glycosyltransferase [Amycolatopsis sp. FU40]AEP40912.1 glycosyl transferases, related to UDP-glucuronosyltransferase [Amycolatopsis sp. FU40]UKD51719.1 glycosyltransferase [Amycolatopsis sp. FU40]